MSRAAIGVPQCMQAERGVTTERPSGSRLATTLRKLPTASPGAKTAAARAAFTPSVSARARLALRAAHAFRSAIEPSSENPSPPRPVVFATSVTWSSGRSPAVESANGVAELSERTNGSPLALQPAPAYR